jgi:uncharacterized protein YdeI (YjbR/CyaY-like superfamily)
MVSTSDKIVLPEMEAPTSAMRKTFQCELEKSETVPYWLAARLPFDPYALWPQPISTPDGNEGARRSRNDMRVKGTIQATGKTAKSDDPIPFSNSFLLKKQGEYLMVVTKKMQNAMRLGADRTVEIVMEPDLEKLDLAVPPELLKLLRQDRAVLKWFGQLAYSVRRWIAGTIREPKSAEARQRRAEQWAERLMLTMEGELEAPPILKSAFRRQPQVEAGWELLTLNQRRVYLLTIFSSKSPEARAKRVEAAVAHSLRAVRRKGRGKSDASEEFSLEGADFREAERARTESLSPRKKIKNPWPSGPFGF